MKIKSYFEYFNSKDKKFFTINQNPQKPSDLKYCDDLEIIKKMQLLENNLIKFVEGIKLQNG